jgi:hypothetical protein
MAKPEGLHCFGHAEGLFIIDCARPPRFDRTVVAPSGADVAQDQEGSRPGVPTFPPVWTAGFLADRVEFELLHRLLNVEIIRSAPEIDLEPGGKTALRG